MKHLRNRLSSMVPRHSPERSSKAYSVGSPGRYGSLSWLSTGKSTLHINFRSRPDRLALAAVPLSGSAIRFGDAFTANGSVRQ